MEKEKDILQNVLEITLSELKHSLDDINALQKRLSEMQRDKNAA